MKQLHQSTLFFRITACIMALSLAVIGCALPASASSDSYIEWSYNAADGTVSSSDPADNGDGQTYTEYTNLPAGVLYEPGTVYRFENQIRVDGVTMDVHSYKRKGDIIILCPANEADGSSARVFVTKEGRQALDAYAHGDYGHVDIAFQQSTKSLSRQMSNDYLADLRKLDEDGLTLPLADLRYATCYAIRSADENDLFRMTVGAIYRLDGQLYFVDYTTLPAGSLGANGTPTYQSGTATLYPLTKTLSSYTENAIEMAGVRSPYYTGEKYDNGLDDPFDDYGDYTEGMVYFTLILYGILLPIAPLVVGLCLPHSKKLGYKKRWYALAIMGGAWMLLGILLTVLMTVLM